MVAVPPVTPVTLPDPSTVALPFDELQLPPVVASVSARPVPAHIGVEPVIVPATGNALTVITVVAATVPQLLVTV